MEHNIVAEDPVCLIEPCGQGDENDLEDFMDKKMKKKQAAAAAK